MVGPLPAMAHKEEKYWYCRRSLRMWPVTGDDVRKSVGIFLRTKLKLEASFLSTIGEIGVKTVPFTARSKIKGEVIVVFGTVEVRDIFRRAARELAGSPEAGIRLEIPQYLQPSLKSLEAVSYALKKKFPGIRRNIKFDDEKLDLVLDFCTDPGADSP